MSLPFCCCTAGLLSLVADWLTDEQPRKCRNLLVASCRPGASVRPERTRAADITCPRLDHQELLSAQGPTSWSGPTPFACGRQRRRAKCGDESEQDSAKYQPDHSGVMHHRLQETLLQHSPQESCFSGRLQDHHQTVSCKDWHQQRVKPSHVKHDST